MLHVDDIRPVAFVEVLLRQLGLDADELGEGLDHLVLCHDRRVVDIGDDRIDVFGREDTERVLHFHDDDPVREELLAVGVQGVENVGLGDRLREEPVGPDGKGFEDALRVRGQQHDRRLPVPGADDSGVLHRRLHLKVVIDDDEVRFVEFLEVVPHPAEHSGLDLHIFLFSVGLDGAGQEPDGFRLVTEDVDFHFIPSCF